MVHRDPHNTRASLRLVGGEACALRWSRGGLGQDGVPGAAGPRGTGADRERALSDAAAALRSARERCSRGIVRVGDGEQRRFAPGSPDGTRMLGDRGRVFLAGASAALEGGRAAILRPARRRRLDRLARSLRIRPFQAALIIAMAQDAARMGSPLVHDAGASDVGIEGAPVGSERPVGPASILVRGLALGMCGAAGVALWFITI
ncbi:MAG: hypothetical protein ACTS3F_03530 [Phycisphaerales bacterium]